MRSRRDIPFDEWQRNQTALEKSPTRGGQESPIAPNYGRADPPPYSQPGQNAPGFAGQFQPAGRSQYELDRPDQPPPWIDDIDVGNNWWSPFQPIWPFGPPGISRPREWDYPVGYNLNYIQPRIELMAMLKGMRATWGVLATIVSTRQDQLLRVPWTIQRKDNPRRSSVAVDEMKKFFKRPDGIHRYDQWARLILDDLLVLDAPCIYFQRDRRGWPLYAEHLSGETIFPLIDDAGRRPQSITELTPEGLVYIKRQPAFQQIIKGMPLVDLDESEIMYQPMRPLPDMPMFGYPPTQQIFIEASEAVRKTIYQLNFWAEGTIPDLIVSVPETWSPRQIAMYQAHFDALLSGNLNLKSKVRFLPGGMKPFDIKNSSGESLWSQRDETLIRLACYAYSVSPTPFVKQVNRSVAQNAQQTSEAEGLFPLMSYWKDDILDVIIQEKFGYDDVEVVFLPRPEPDGEKASKIYDTKIKNGSWSINEARDADGLEPIVGGDEYLIHVGNAVIPLEDAAKGLAMPVQGGTGQAGDSGSIGANTQVGKPNARENTPQRGAPVPPNAPVAKLNVPDKSQIRDAANDAKGHLEHLSNSQLHAGNYSKGHLRIYGLDVSIENNTGSLRGEKDQNGTKWSVRMPAPYGYIRGTVGADGDSVDCYIGRNPKSDRIWVIDQNKVSKKGKIKGFDEHKVMLAYKNVRRAVRDYLRSHFDDHGHDRLTAVTELSIPEFRDWLKNGDLKEPMADQGYGKVLDLKNEGLVKLDTISTATNLVSYDQGPRTKSKLKRKSKIRARRSQGPRWLNLNAGVN